MVFSSIPFLFFFLPVFLVLYHLIPEKFTGWRNGILLLFSLVFYAWGEPIYILLMLLVTLSDYVVGLFMERANATWKKVLLGWSLFFDLMILCFFKYADFLTGSINQIFHTNIKMLELALPLGISFFTFQTLSYVIDLYRGEIKSERNYFTYLTYVSMFPQLVAGPIVRYATVHSELKNRRVNWQQWQEGFHRFLRGLFKKVLLANQIGKLWDAVSGSELHSASIITIWLGAIAFTFQIYYDFSGYSDMAIGMGRMMGFHFDENFNHPLAANSITDFWRRWHISLSTWFRNYVYIPLGGNRVSRGKHIRNIMVVWLLTGLWHGASWNFVCWGLYYGIWLLLEKLVYGKWLEKWPAVVKHIYSWLIVVIGFVLFAIEDFGRLGIFLKAMLGIGIGGLEISQALYFIRNYGAIFVICFIFAWPLQEWLETSKIKAVYSKISCYGKPVIYLCLFGLTIASLVSDSYNPFLYFRF